MASSRYVRIAYRSSLALLGLAVAVVEALNQSKAVHLSRWWDFAVLTVVGLATFFDNVRALVRAQSEARLAESKRKVFRNVVAALSVLAEDGNVSILHLGASVFLVKRKLSWVGRARWYWPWSRRERLDRWDRLRLSHSPQPSKVTWVRSKGAVGTAWHTARACHRDWTGINARWAAAPPNEQQFNGISASTRGGLEYEEFCALLGKYSETLAVPIIDSGGNVFGVVSVDVSCAASSSVVLDAGSVTRLMEDTIGTIRPELSK